MQSLNLFGESLNLVSPITLRSAAKNRARWAEDHCDQTILDLTDVLEPSNRSIQLSSSLPGNDFGREKIRRGNNEFTEEICMEKLHVTIRLLLPITACPRNCATVTQMSTGRHIS